LLCSDCGGVGRVCEGVSGSEVSSSGSFNIGDTEGYRVKNETYMSTRSFFVATVLLITGSVLVAQTESRPRVRDLGVQVGVLPPGPMNAITDVAGSKPDRLP
jgi:hypothetical protein